METGTSPKLSSLPSSNPARWLPRHKADVVAAVAGGRLSLADACDRYALTVEEFASWLEGIDSQGVAGLRARGVQERRNSARRTVREPAQVVLNSDAAIGCAITDISKRGARLELKKPEALPQSFELRCDRSERSLRVLLVWQRERSVGVSFDMAAPWAIVAGLDVWLLGESS